MGVVWKAIGGVGAFVIVGSWFLNFAVKLLTRNTFRLLLFYTFFGVVTRYRLFLTLIYCFMFTLVNILGVFFGLEGKSVAFCRQLILLAILLSLSTDFESSYLLLIVKYFLIFFIDIFLSRVCFCFPFHNNCLWVDVLLQSFNFRFVVPTLVKIIFLCH